MGMIGFDSVMDHVDARQRTVVELCKNYLPSIIAKEQLPLAA